MSYRLVIRFDSVEELIEKLGRILAELRGAVLQEGAKSGRRAALLFDETVRGAGSLALRLAKEMGFDAVVYEVSSSIREGAEIDGVRLVPVKDDLDVLRKAEELGAILITGDKRLARTAKVYGIRVVYHPPAGVESKEHYVIEVMKKVKEMLKKGVKSVSSGQQ